MIKVKHITPVVIGDYPFAKELKTSILPLLEDFKGGIPHDETNVKAIHTEWDWESENIYLKKLKIYLLNEVERNFSKNVYNFLGSKEKAELTIPHYWGNVYNKGDYAQEHSHFPCAFSIVYFLKSQWYHSPFIFSDSGKKVRPKEGRFVIFPAYLWHKVPKHQFKETRITLSGNVYVK